MRGLGSEIGMIQKCARPSWLRTKKHTRLQPTLHLMSHKLKVEHTFFQHNEYATFVSLGDDRTPSMHDVISVSQAFHKRVRNCQVVDDGVDSDHSAVCITISLTSIKFKGKAISKESSTGTRYLLMSRRELCIPNTSRISPLQTCLMKISMLEYLKQVS